MAQLTKCLSCTNRASRSPAALIFFFLFSRKVLRFVFVKQLQRNAKYIYIVENTHTLCSHDTSFPRFNLGIQACYKGLAGEKNIPYLHNCKLPQMPTLQEISSQKNELTDGAHVGFDCRSTRRICISNFIKIGQLAIAKVRYSMSTHTQPTQSIGRKKKKL